jgi:hypothetical protein
MAEAPSAGSHRGGDIDTAGPAQSPQHVGSQARFRLLGRPWGEPNRPTVCSECVRFDYSGLTTSQPDYGPIEGNQVRGSLFEGVRKAFAYNDESNSAQLRP